ncbi:MAG: hypothetical protein ACI9PU_001381 [Ascidiaceihabitans sp.]|jgi:hypothetical protein
MPNRNDLSRRWRDIRQVKLSGYVMLSHLFKDKNHAK